MRKAIKILVIGLFLLILVGCNRSEYTYIDKGEIVTISEYTGSDMYVVVPNMYQSKIVDTIDYNTYAYNINIYHVRLSENIRLIRDCAFWYCTSLETIYIPKGLEKIEEAAFYRCDSLKYIYFEDSENNINLEIIDNNDWFKNAKALYNVSVEEYEELNGYNN